MSELKNKVETYIIELICDKCEGNMKRLKMDWNEPPRIRYVCNSCGCEIIHTDEFPKIEYKYI